MRAPTALGSNRYLNVTKTTGTISTDCQTAKHTLIKNKKFDFSGVVESGGAPPQLNESKYMTKMVAGLKPSSQIRIKTLID